LSVAEGARRLAAGEVIAFPTETVYGLGADATNAAAVAQIFALKGRPSDHPLIVHFADPAHLDEWALEIPATARLLAEHFWPGPLTLILRRSARVPAGVTGGQQTVGLRCPSHPVAQALLAEFAGIGSGAVAAPSANKFGHVSPTTADHVREEFGPGLFVLDGGACDVGLESTIVDLSRAVPALLRPGGVSRADLEAALGMALLARDAASPRASGTLAAHYAPRTMLDLIEASSLDDALLDARRVAVLALRAPQPAPSITRWITAPFDAVRYGHDLYANLRALDRSGAECIVVEAPPRTPPWEAVNDRLARAAAGAGGFGDEP
jgi:L-threonylcarbamoyladenylate synthase